MSRKQQVVLTKVNIHYILAKKVKLSKYGMAKVYSWGSKLGFLIVHKLHI